ncbi:MAG: DUF6522 family protein [Acetobacteraceae bacterium]|nr:DUF6522 family protein [Acetobacteraceae bacterium]
MERLELDGEGGVVIPAEWAAERLGVPLRSFLADLRSGRVFSLVERGEGEDAGRLRATLRHRGREFRVVLEAASGRVLATDQRPGPGPAAGPPPCGRPGGGGSACRTEGRDRR